MTTRALPVVTNERPDLCTPCGGKCCKREPGYTHPDDWGSADAEREPRITAALASGRVIVDTSCGQWGVRPATVAEVGGVDVDREDPEAWWPFLEPAGRCALLDDATGCALPYAERPRQCRDLVPGVAVEHGRATACRSPGGWDVFATWGPHRALLARCIESARATRARRAGAAVGCS